MKRECEDCGLTTDDFPWWFEDAEGVFERCNDGTIRCDTCATAAAHTRKEGQGMRAPRKIVAWWWIARHPLKSLAIRRWLRETDGEARP